jgi:hypothetical protein
VFVYGRFVVRSLNGRTSTSARISVVVLSLLSGTFGCVGVAPALQTVTLNAPPRPLHERPPGEVTFFTTGAPSRPFVEVALLESRRRWGAQEGAPEIIGRMRDRAAKLGCDGLILLGEANLTSGFIYPTPGVQGPETWGDVETIEGYRATCIAWSDEAAPAPAAPAPPPAPAQ